MDFQSRLPCPRAEPLQTISATRQPAPTLFDGRIPAVLGSSGLLLPSMEGKIVREDGTEAGVNEPGELWLRGGNVVQGYWGDDEATRKTFYDGWLKTGDQFKIDELGRLLYVPLHHGIRAAWTLMMWRCCQLLGTSEGDYSVPSELVEISRLGTRIH